MYTKISLFSLVLGLFLVIPVVTVEASSVIRTGDAVSVENDQKIEGDFYSLSNILSISGEIAGDMTSVGRKVTLNGNVTSDALIAGESVDVHGAVGDDLRVIGGDVVIAKPITGDVFVIAGSVTVLSTASIGGDLVIYAGDADISGSVGGNILGRAESLRIDAPVGGLVDVKAGALTVGDKADIAGSVQYESLANLERSPNAKVAGDIVRNDPIEEDSNVSHKTFLIPLLMALFSTLVWYLVAKTTLIRITERALVRGIRPSATGFIFFFAAPVVIGILLLSVLGTMVGVAALVAYIFAILIALFSVSAVVGQIMMYVYKKRFPPITPMTLIVGVIGVCVLVLIPIVGPLVLIGLLIITLGAIVDLILHPSR